MSEKSRYFSVEFTLCKTEATIFVFPMIRVVTNANIVIIKREIFMSRRNNNQALLQILLYLNSVRLRIILR